MGCTSCHEKGQACDGSGACDLKNSKATTQARINALRRCEPFCTNGGCAPDYAAMVRQSPLVTFLMNIAPSKLALAGFNIGTDPATGLPCIAVPGGPCVPLSGCDPCRQFGPHANAAVRNPSFSPDDIAAIAATYGYEEVTVGPPIAVPGVGATWGIVALGALAVSHKFCIREVSGTTDTGALSIQSVRIAGSRIVCSVASPGSTPWAMDNTVGADPNDIDITAFRCACKNLCAWTPEAGLEFIMIQSADPLLLDPDTEITLKIERSDWLREVDPCVPAKGNRLLFTDFNPDFAQAYRVTAGAIPMLP